MEAEKAPVVPAPVEEMVKLHRGISTTSPVGYPEASTPQAARGLTWVPSPTAEGMIPVTPTAHYPALPSMLVRRSLPNVKVCLENADLWRKFHKIGTEMIITKTGRRMFPPLQVSVTGLNTDSEYYFLLELAPVTSEIPSLNGRTRDIETGDCASSPRPSLVHRLRFSGREWVVAGRGEAQAPTSSRIYVHPDSPAHGSRWMKGFGRRNDHQEQSEREPDDEGQKDQRKLHKKKHIISFSKVKLTNNSLDGRGHVVLTSMHKYIPRIHIVKASDYMSLSWGPEAVFSFPETEFVAVTAYQNGKITKLKIDHNPFAKGFRENGMSKSKRKLEMMKDSDDGGNSSDEELTKISCLDCNNNGNTKRIRANSVQSTSIESGPSRSPTSSPEGSTAGQSYTSDDHTETKTQSVAQEPTNGYFPFLWASFAQQTGLQMANYDQRYFAHPLLPSYPTDTLPSLAHRGLFPYQTPSSMVPPLWKMPFLYPSSPSYYGLSAHHASTDSYSSHAHFSAPLPGYGYLPTPTKIPSIPDTHPYLLDLSSKNA